MPDTQFSGQDSSNRRVAWLARAWCAIIITSAVATWVVLMLNRPAQDNILQAAGSATTLLGFSAFGVTGALIISRQPRNTVGWLLMLEGSLALAWPLDIHFNSLAQPPAQPSGLFMLGLWFWGWLWLWLIFPILFIPLFFPTGRPPSARWRWLIALGLGLCAFFILFVTFVAEFTAQGETWTVPNPIGFLPNGSFPMLPWTILLLSFAALSVASLFVRYRRAKAVEREQIKWLLYAAGVFFLIYAGGFVFSDLDGVAGDLWDVALWVGILLLPAAIAIAILRFRLYGIDVIIRKTLVYGALTGLLALVYFGSVVLLQQLLGTTTGAAVGSPLAIVVSTLAIAALFTPLRRRIQDGIDRRFYRKKYNAQQVLAQFALTARDETDLDALTTELVWVVMKTLQPERVGVWLRKHEVPRNSGAPSGLPDTKS